VGNNLALVQALDRQSGLAEVSLRFEPEGVACDLRIEDAALA
jgi:hypothetical protein